MKRKQTSTYSKINKINGVPIDLYMNRIYDAVMKVCKDHKNFKNYKNNTLKSFKVRSRWDSTKKSKYKER